MKDNFDLKKYLAENRLLKENDQPLNLTPQQKQEFLDRIKYLIDSEGLDYTMWEAGNILARVLTQDEAEFIEDVEDFGYNAEEVENYAQDLVGNNLAEGKLLKENTINNKYVVKDEELSDEDGDFYVIDPQKAYDYLSQFDDDMVDAELFMDDDEGWGEFISYLDNVEQMSDEELEDAMRQEMSFYYYSDGDSI